MFTRFVDALASLDERVTVDASRVELRFLYDGVFLCRLAPYRELFHVQIGEDPMWETRVRTEETLVAAIDRVLLGYLELYASRAA
jgi:hypothetical protein